jgi:hypothetical protein
MERSLAMEGWLPKQPGRYTIAVTWQPATAPDDKTYIGVVPPAAKPYAVVRALATFGVVKGKVSPRGRLAATV